MSELAIPGVVIPGIPDTADPVMQMTAAWLISRRSPNTMTGYRRDLLGIGKNAKPARMTVPAWLPWLERSGVDPLCARRAHVDTYSRLLDLNGSSPATILRKIAAISSWYTYLIQEGATEANPAERAARPEVDQSASTTSGLDQDEALKLIEAADRDGLRTAAIVRVLLYGGWRIDLVIRAVVSDLGHDRGHRTIKVRMKGGKIIKAPLSAPVSTAVDAHLATREDLTPASLIFATSEGAPLDEPYLWRLIRRIARKAAIPSWDELSPHSLRHTFATLSFDFGVPLADVQDAMGHSDPRTTRRYDRSRHRLDRHPTYVLADKLGAARNGEPS
jgi:integrase/recombinase XerD